MIEDSAEFKLLHKCVLDDNCWATPAIAQGSLYIRTYSKLYRLQSQD
ncbi:MAG: hypothetical protein K8T89_23305 [Planctomycetes bacterium]|nr:hypothetical protein [Planctomycetota bacterium]